MALRNLDDSPGEKLIFNFNFVAKTVKTVKSVPEIELDSLREAKTVGGLMSKGMKSIPRERVPSGELRVFIKNLCLLNVRSIPPQVGVTSVSSGAICVHDD